LALIPQKTNKRTITIGTIFFIAAKFVEYGK